MPKPDVTMPKVSRVTLAVQAPAPDRELLDAAASLARAMQAELAGLFVEDMALLRGAALPITREVGRVSGVARAFDVPDVERVLRRQAEQVREGLASVARSVSLTWSFEVRRGDLVEQALALLAPTELVVLSIRSAHAPRPPTQSGGVIAVLEAAEEELQTLSVALQLAQGRALSLLLVAATEAEFSALRARVERGLPGSAAPASIEHAPSAPLRQLAQLPELRHSRALVLGARSVKRNHGALQALLRSVRGPVILVG
jgi:hypothetical protein